jgi:pimeloyl-ACP methyl ester carboxylesterase/acyl-CoA thioesterase FadM
VTLPAVEVMVYPFECDAFGHLNQAACLALLERARWDALARGPGVDLFKRHGLWPAARRTTIDYRAAAFAGDVLRVEMQVIGRGTTSFTMRHHATRLADGERIAEADMVFVCIDRVGRPQPIPDEIARALGVPRGGRDVLRVAVPGAELAVEVRGEGQAIVFVHGFPLDRSLWRHQLAGLSRWKRVAPDLRGFGGSSAPADGYSMARFADDLVAVLDALALERAVFCGLSMGGYVVLDLLRRHADRVRAVVLADTRAEADTAEARQARDELAALAEREGPDGVATRMLPQLLATDTPANQPEVVTHVREMIRRTPVAGIVGALRAMKERPDSRGMLRHVAVPTLVLVGADDRLTPPAAARVIADAVPGARYAEVPGAGHLAPLEQPLVSGRLIADFLAELG